MTDWQTNRPTNRDVHEGSWGNYTYNNLLIRTIVICRIDGKLLVMVGLRLLQEMMLLMLFLRKVGQYSTGKAVYNTTASEAAYPASVSEQTLGRHIANFYWQSNVHKYLIN